MPFTPAHPAAIIPFTGKHFVPAALVVGSMSPDFAYFIPGRFNHHIGHTLPGVFLFSIPAGLAALFLFEMLLKVPLAKLLPERLQLRLGPAMNVFRFGPARRFALITLSLFVGVLTHISWDSITHKQGFLVAMIPVLSRQGLKPLSARFRCSKCYST